MLADLAINLLRVMMIDHLMFKSNGRHAIKQALNAFLTGVFLIHTFLVLRFYPRLVVIVGTLVVKLFSSFPFVFVLYKFLILSQDLLLLLPLLFKF
jgi:hypothetical protein